jgi:hypothetical protein
MYWKDFFMNMIRKILLAGVIFGASLASSAVEAAKPVVQEAAAASGVVSEELTQKFAALIKQSEDEGWPEKRIVDECAKLAAQLSGSSNSEEIIAAVRKELAPIGFCVGMTGGLIIAYIMVKEAFGRRW